MNTNNSLNGFIVVRLPEFCVNEGTWSTYPALTIANRYLRYGGVDRMRWHDADTLFYEGSDTEFNRTYKSIQGDGRIGLRACSDLLTARYICDSCNSLHITNELLFVTVNSEIESSAYVRRLDASVEFVGYDVLSFGFWSLLNEGLFRKPVNFIEYQHYLNTAGLLVDRGIVNDLARSYEEISKVGSVEPLPVPGVYRKGLPTVGTIVSISVWKIYF